MTDKDGGTGSASKTIAVLNAPPTARIVGAPPTGVEGTEISVTGTVSDAGALDTFSYRWSVAKNGVAFGAVGTGAAFAFTPDGAGDYVMTLRVTDKDGRTATDSAVIFVSNVNPHVNIVGAPATITMGSPVSLTSTVTDPGAADTFAYAWRVTKDGVAFASGTDADFSFTPLDDAIYEVTLNVADHDGGTGADGVLIISQAAPVIGSGPTADVNPALPLQAVHFFCQASDADTITWSWDFGDGIVDNSNSNAVTHAFSPAGTYVVTVTATDANGLSTAKSLTMQINPVGDITQEGAALDSDGDGVADNIELAMGTDPLDADSTPLVDAPGQTPQTLTVLKMGVTLCFTKPGNDAIVVSGALPVPAGFKAAGKTLAVDVSGIARVFTLDAKGFARLGKDAITMRIRASKGNAAAQVAKFTLKLQKGDFAAALKNEGLSQTPAVGPRVVVVTIIFNGTMYQKSQTVFYTNLIGAKGSAK
ncbi:MAG: PKD domain-containing protein [Planctomycetota bacterium]|nr:PKD domain-containing protein [Planctomycetota bacterium]